MKDLYDIYGTETNFEVDGVWLDFGTARIKVARAGNKNTFYLKTFRKVMKKYNKVNFESLKEDEGDIILADIFSQSIIKSWEIKNENNEWEPGLILLVDGEKKKVPSTSDNIKKCLLDLPDLFREIRESADNIKTFQKESEDTALKN